MTIRIGTNEPGGTFNAQGKALAAVLGENGFDDIEILTTPNASVANANHLDLDEVDFGFMASNWIGRALAGTPPFDHPIALRMVSPANAGPMFFIARADSGIRTVADIKGRRLAVGAEGGGMTQHVHTIFDVLGISFDDFTPVYVNFPDGAAALEAGEVDVQWQCPIPNRVMTDLADRCAVRVMSYGDGDLDRLLSEVPYYRPAVVAKGAFPGANEDVPQVGVLNVLVCHERMDEAVVRKLVASMVANSDGLTRHCPLYGSLPPLWEPMRSQGAAAFDIDGVSLHPGAVAAYADAGYLA
jgi:TRAP transporter TAXI family solute receptor